MHSDTVDTSHCGCGEGRPCTCTNCSCVDCVCAHACGEPAGTAAALTTAGVGQTDNQEGPRLGAPHEREEG